MPTENRSSNTEMVSDLLPCPFCGEKPQITKHHREDIYSFMHRCPVLGPISWGFREDPQAHVEKWNARAQPAPQPHPEPIAWMVGTAFWWTKEEAERDAAATGLPVVPVGQMVAQHGEPVWFMTEGGVSALHAKAKAMSDQQGLDTSSYCVPLYTHADSGEVERLRADLEGLSNDFDRSQHELGERTTERNTLRAQLADRDTLIDEVLKAFQLNADGNGSCHNPGLSFIRPWAERVAALSASADPSVPAERDEPVCKGDWQLGTACGKCRRCKGNSPA